MPVAITNPCNEVHESLACRSRLTFMAASDEGLFADDVLSARIEREAASCKRFVQDMSTLGTIADLSRWLHATHLCYAVARQREFGINDNLPPKALATY